MEVGWGAWTGLIRLRIGTGDGLLCMPGFRKMRGICGPADDVLASQEGLCSKEFVNFIGCMCTKYFPSVRGNQIADVKHIRSRVLWSSQREVGASIGRNFCCYTVLYLTSEISLNLVELFAMSKCHV